MISHFRRPTLAERLGMPRMDIDLDLNDVGEYLVRPSHVAVLAGVALALGAVALYRTYDTAPSAPVRRRTAKKSGSRGTSSHPEQD